ncbi:MAG TPA: NAD-glutamate dehydrogenase, partial [Nocardioides sp.]|nr:NAD-glutamate dehydrogenase [Nocardioides sp.]
MSTATDLKKSELLDRATQLAMARKGSGGPPSGEVGDLIRAYYRHIGADDLAERSDVDLYAALASQFRLADNRPQGRANVHVFTPSHADSGWSAGGHSVIEIVTDDMSFLVDSVTMELARQQREIHLVVHPQFDVVRDITGVLESVHPIQDESKPPAEGAIRESWMHIEISRLGIDEDPAELEEAIQKVLREVRDSVEDWDKMRAQAREIVEELTSAPPPLDAVQIERGRAFLTWLADDHFAFLGYREYHLEREGDDEILRAVPGTGLGILRADQDQSRAFAKLPEAAKAKAREKTLLVLSKANSRATVHRPAYLDYVGVKTFDENGEVKGERRFLGLLSSAAYTESITRIPLLREKAADVLTRIGVDPHSHAGKSLMDTLETY